MARIGVLITDSMFRSGGVFQYSMSLLEALDRIGTHKYIIFYENPRFCEYGNIFKSFELVEIPKIKSKFKRYIKAAATFAGLGGAIRKIYRPLCDTDIDLLISPDSILGLKYLGVPYIVVIHDLMHRYYPSFPEYPLRERGMRDVNFGRSGRNSVITVTESDQSKKDMMRFYGVSADNLRIVPFCPPWFSYRYADLDEIFIDDVIRRYSLPKRFLFYPAQFWHHKNHERLIRALKVAQEKFGDKISLVLSGAARNESRGTYAKVMSLVDELGLADRVFHIGYIDEKEMVAIYKRASALIYPTLIGPTNVPILESMNLGTPVVCSNLFAMPGQVGDAAILFNPFDVEDMAESIYKIWTDGDMRNRLVKDGHKRVTALSFEAFSDGWKHVIDDSLVRIGKDAN